MTRKETCATTGSRMWVRLIFLPTGLPRLCLLCDKDSSPTHLVQINQDNDIRADIEMVDELEAMAAGRG